jgi:hypothetical protein
MSNRNKDHDPESAISHRKRKAGPSASISNIGNRR